MCRLLGPPKPCSWLTVYVYHVIVGSLLTDCDLDSLGRIPHLCTKLAESTYKVSQKHRTVSKRLLLATGCYWLRCSAYNKSKLKFAQWFNQTQHNKNVVLIHTHNTRLPSRVYSRVVYASYRFWNIKCPDFSLRRHSWRQSCSRESNRAAAAVRSRNLASPVWVSGSPSHHRPAFCLCSLASGKRTFSFSSGPAAEILVTSIISPVLLSKTFVTPTDKNYLYFRHGPFIH